MVSAFKDRSNQISKRAVAIIDYDMGNVKSIANAIAHIGGYEISVTANEDKIRAADVIILPGVGAFPDAMQKLDDRKLLPILNEEVVGNAKPALGICLGMQLLFDFSEEKGITPGLGWIPGEVLYIDPPDNLRLPHIGWNTLKLLGDDQMFSFLGSDKDFYFVHSLNAICDDRFVLAKIQYGVEVVAAVRYGNIVGMQFHPEKSQKNGLAALRSFFRHSLYPIGEESA